MADPVASRSCLLTKLHDSVQHLREKVQSHFPVDGSGDGSATHFPMLPNAASERQMWTPGDQVPRDRVLGRSTTQRTQISTRSARSVFEGALNHLRGPQAVAPDVDDLWQQFRKKRELVRSGSCKLATFQFGSDLPEIRKVLGSSAIDPGQLQIVREVFLEIVRASYWEQLQEGRFLVGSKEPDLLLNSVSLAKDNCSTRLADWYILERDFGLTKLSQFEQAGLQTSDLTAGAVRRGACGATCDASSAPSRSPPPSSKRTSQRRRRSRLTSVGKPGGSQTPPRRRASSSSPSFRSSPRPPR